MKCDCPTRCKFCGLRRSRDAVGHYCKTKNCEWQHGYSGCQHMKRKPSEFVRGLMAAKRIAAED